MRLSGSNGNSTLASEIADLDLVTPAQICDWILQQLGPAADRVCKDEEPFLRFGCKNAMVEQYRHGPPVPGSDEASQSLTPASSEPL